MFFEELSRVEWFDKSVECESLPFYAWRPFNTNFKLGFLGKGSKKHAFYYEGGDMPKTFKAVDGLKGVKKDLQMGNFLTGQLRG